MRPAAPYDEAEWAGAGAVVVAADLPTSAAHVAQQAVAEEQVPATLGAAVGAERDAGLHQLPSTAVVAEEAAPARPSS